MDDILDENGPKQEQEPKQQEVEEHQEKEDQEKEKEEKEPTDQAVHVQVVDEDANDDEYTDSIIEIATAKGRGRGHHHHGLRRRSSTLDRRLSAGSIIRRRPSSAFTGGSGGSIDESLITKSSIISKKSAEHETLKLHKEVIEQAKYQLWPLDKKLRVITTAKEYVKRHETELQEKFAQKRTFSTIRQQIHFLMIRFLQLLWRFLKELVQEITPWQQRIKDIESHFGSVVSSYFIFLRWLFWMNFVIMLVLTIFVIVPEVLAADWSDTGARKKMLPVERHYAYNLKVMWDFEGILRYSPIFYGYFSSRASTKAGYQIPLAYFCAGMSVYVFSFAIILKKMAKNSKQSKLSEKGDECTFTWKVFASWDYGIANVETAHNKVASIIMGFREALVEEMEKEKLHEKSWKLIGKRVLANFLVLLLLIGSAYAVVFVVERSTKTEVETSWYRQNEITIVMSMISITIPNVFEVIGLLEQYHPRKAMRWMLARIMALNLLSLYTLIFALFGKTDGMISALRKMEEMKNQGVNFGLDSPTTTPPVLKDCFQVPIPCELLARDDPSLPPVLSLYYEFEDMPQQNGIVPNISAPTAERPQTIDFIPGQVNSTDEAFLDETVNGRRRDGNIDDGGSFTDDGLLSLWLRNLTRQHPQDNCKTCLARCGHSCFDLCHIVRNCSTDPESQYRSNSKLTTLVFLMRGLLNASDLVQDDYIDDFGECSRCVLHPEEDDLQDVGMGGQDGRDSSKQTKSFTRPYLPYPDPGPQGGFVPLDDRHCTKQICRRRFFGTIKPTQIQPPKETCTTAVNRYVNDLKESLHLRQLCWETMFGQELVKLTVMDTIFMLMSIFIVDFLRSIFLRAFNPYWFWDMEKKFPKYPDFKVAENVLHLVNNQGMIWMGLFMAPGLPAINLIKLAIIMYARSWAVMTTNVPHETVFRASRSNNFYFILLLMMLFLCTLPVAYAIVWLKPSWHCGPFSKYDRMFKVFTEKIFELLPQKLHGAMDYLTSPGIVIPVFVLLVLIIYYLISLTRLLREANDDLKNQLHHERTEERRKLLQSRQAGGVSTMTAAERWKRLLGSALSSTRESADLRKLSDVPARHDVGHVDNGSGDFSERAIDVPGQDVAGKGRDEDGDHKSSTKTSPSFADIIKKRILNLEQPTSSFTSMSELANTAEVNDSNSGNAPDGSHMPRSLRGSMCNRFTMETDTSSQVSNGLAHGNQLSDDEGHENESNGEESSSRPPKIWISKSASMEHDLD